MKKDLTEIVFILDKSGSMSGLEKDTIGGYNAFVEKQKAVEGGALVSTILFSDRSEVIHDRVPLAEVEKLTEAEYSVGGCTALLDAVGLAIQHIVTIHKYAREEDRPEKTVFVITTDGEENSSREYSYPRLNSMIERQQEASGWEFIFLGANIDAISEGAKLGISQDRAVSYECDGAGTLLNFACVGEAIRRVRTGRSLDASWKCDIEDYHAAKKAGKSRRS
ncbi:MAG: VWA domain-containing protein [Treponema sp.]|nr:VWA domain-containing protein [Treponema sp.]